jgi:hypothetical protein
MSNRLTFILLSSFCCQYLSAADDTTFFESKIRPVLVDKCYSCHSAEAEKIKGGLLLDTREGIRRGGDTGPAVVPGDLKKSLLIAAIRYEDDLEMPPKEKLSAEVIADFEKWIISGAADPREGKAGAVSTIDLDEGRKHWSFQPITSPPVPTVKDTSWPRTDIDRFILATLEAKGLKPVTDATAEQMRRRVALDLTGLPPDQTDPSDLMRTRRFAERWARHWLDVARYAESTGGGHNVMLPLAFRYRDWVVDAIHADLPYDHFVRQQIAGDLLHPKDDAAAIATGFLCIGTKDLRENDQKRFRMDMAEEQLDALGRAFLGLTIACAKCHDHKFDPIPTRDYYALAGILTSSEPMLGARRNRQRDPFAAGVLPMAAGGSDFTDADQASMLKQRVELTYAQLKHRDARWAVMDELKIPIKKATKEQDAIVDARESVKAAAANVEKLRMGYETLRQRYNAALQHSMTALREDKPVDVPIHIRGEDAHLGEIVPRGFLQVLTTPETKPVNRNQSGRLELAEWIASQQNPLTARVMVNRLWQHLFGTGLVETPDDFGKTGQPPSNAALLDHLATRFIAHGWSLKKMIAEIMQSRVYHLSTAHHAAAYEADPANRLHWRMNRRRLDSDALIDSVLHISGSLKLGPPAPRYVPMDKDDRIKEMRPPEWLAPLTQHRTIYQPVLRDYVPEDWKVFDFPDPELVTGKRSITTVPTQALYLMNSPFIVEQSQKTANKLMQATSDTNTLIQAAYQAILSRQASTQEMNDALALWKALDGSKALPALCQTLFASAEFRTLD